VKKTVGSVPYSLIAEDDTTKYGCEENCIYTRDDQPGGKQFCFKAGNLESACNQDMEDNIIFIGPSRNSPESWMFLLPSFRKADCRPPPFPYAKRWDIGGYWEYEARMTDDGPLFCGGAIDESLTNRCFLIANNGSWTETSPLPVTYAKKPQFPSVEFGEGWWIADFSKIPTDTSTLLWNGSAWQDYVNLPKPFKRFCMTAINSTHVFFSGGINMPGEDISTECYIYSNATGFVQIANMTRERGDHACGVLDGRFVFVAGGGAEYKSWATQTWNGDRSEYFSLETMTWNDGPEIDYSNDPSPRTEPWQHEILSQGSKMYLITNYNIYTLENADSENVTDWEWVKSAELEFAGGHKDVFLMKTEDCKNWKL